MSGGRQTDRVKDVTTDNSAAFQLGQHLPSDLQVPQQHGFEQFNKNAVQAAKSLNTGADLAASLSFIVK